MNQVNTQRTARLLQKTLGDILLQEAASLFGNAMVSVTEVQVSPNCGIAKVYLSMVLSPSSKDSLAQVNQHKGKIRKLLGQRLGNKLRKVPELRFYADDSAAHAAKINHLLKALDLPEKADGV